MSHELLQGHGISFLIAEAHGHAVVPLADGKFLLVTSGEDGTVRMFDVKTGMQTTQIAVGADPDAAIEDPATHLVYVMDGSPGSVVVLDPKAGRVVATIPVKPGLEFPAIVGTRLYVNNEKLGELEVIDLMSRTFMATIALTGCDAPTGLAYDAPSARLISACANGHAAIIDPVTATLVGLLQIARGPDAVIIDPVRRRAFIPCGRDGILEVLTLDGPHGIEVAEHVPTEIGARTGALDPSDGTIYLPTARTTPGPAGTRPVPVPGTFHMVVVKPD